MQQPATATDLTLNDVKLNFERWRATRVRRGKIPESLWLEVKTLLGRYSTSQITQTLGINAYQISSGITDKNKITFVSARPESLAKSAPISSISASRSGETCSIELQRACGAVLKISQLPLMSLAGVITQFMER